MDSLDVGSDRGPRFSCLLGRVLGASLSLGFYPQPNGQTVRKNQDLRVTLHGLPGSFFMVLFLSVREERVEDAPLPMLSPFLFSLYTLDFRHQSEQRLLHKRGEGTCIQS